MNAESRPASSVNSEGGLQTREILGQEERYRLKEGVAVVFFHAPGVGGSTLARNFAKAINVDIEGDHFYDGGRDLREKTGNTASETNFMSRPKSADRDIDQTQMDLFSIATIEKPVVINAKLAGRNARRFMKKHPEVKIIVVLVTCDAGVAAYRMRDRKIGELDEKFIRIEKELRSGIISQEEYDSLLDSLEDEAAENTVDNIRTQTINRIAKDMDRFTALYPELQGIKSLYVPEPTVITGKKVDPKTGEEVLIREKLFNHQVSTTRKKPEESLKDLLNKLLEAGEIEKVELPPPAINLESDLLSLQ